MRTKIVAMLIALFPWSAALTAAETVPAGLADLARAAVHGNPANPADPAIAALRQAGPAGMEAVLAMTGSGLQDAVDRVCGVRDCAEIRLFWYTDLDAAKAAARATGKPILSLRLMGRLDEELSCANSRFFRTVFYKNREINDLLRQRYVLHWRSVRPVPRVTIDFGDGSRLERTLTGNSIHYVLDSRGRLVDALPGLSGPREFLDALEAAATAARTAEGLDDDTSFKVWAAERHKTQLVGRGGDLARDLEALRPPPAAPRAPRAPKVAAVEAPKPEQAQAREAIPAGSAARDPWAILASTPGVLTERLQVGGGETGSKMTAEGFILSRMSGFDRLDSGELPGLARLRRPSVHLDPESRAFLLRKQGVTDPSQAERLVDAFEATVALDEVINDYRTGPAILKRLSEPELGKAFDLEAFNQWVYEEVFRTPLSDPWLGLAPDDVYAALPDSTRTSQSP
jgi:hypothetical protein